MARPNPNRFPAAKAIAAHLPALLAVTMKGNAADKAASQEAAAAASRFNVGDITEANRRDIYAGARVMLVHAGYGAKYAPALRLYAESLIAFAVTCDYDAAMAKAGAAVAALKPEPKAKKKAA